MFNEWLQLGRFKIQDSKPIRTSQKVPSYVWFRGQNMLIDQKQCFVVWKTWSTLIWLSAESLRPVMSKTFIHVLICLPNFFVAEGYRYSKQNGSQWQGTHSFEEVNGKQNLPI